MFGKLLADTYNSTQARTLLIAGVALALIYYTDLNKLLVLLLSLLVTSYIINCLVRGNCEIIAWVYVVMNVLITYQLLNGKL